MATHEVEGAPAVQDERYLNVVSDTNTDHSEFQTVLLAYFLKPGRGWHGRTIELEPALGCGNGSDSAPELFPQPRAGSSGRSGEVAQVKAVFPTVKNRRLGHTVDPDADPDADPDGRVSTVNGSGTFRLKRTDSFC